MRDENDANVCVMLGVVFDCDVVVIVFLCVVSDYECVRDGFVEMSVCA